MAKKKPNNPAKATHASSKKSAPIPAQAPKNIPNPSAIAPKKAKKSLRPFMIGFASVAAVCALVKFIVMPHMNGDIQVLFHKAMPSTLQEHFHQSDEKKPISKESLATVSGAKQPTETAGTSLSAPQNAIVDITTAVTGDTSADTLQAQQAGARAVQATLALSQKLVAANSQNITQTTNPQTGEIIRTVVQLKEVPVEKRVEVLKTPKSVQHALALLQALSVPNTPRPQVDNMALIVAEAPDYVQTTYKAYVKRWDEKNANATEKHTENTPLFEKILSKVISIEKRPAAQAVASTSVQQRKAAFQQAVLAWAVASANE